ncbi:tRNA uridine-5-carboxymethylaminomethyl(34) synthesis GTPase MnmE [Mesorhizobium sp. CAU 1732]|uniref:tRNA uridine-5-carboxymethylaminomethyl(34) synthesis GTPase MnmE n=1 Tax=Mesorhizobium sp. CAU 1732 TaxID=3140358 RepID=UPI0032609E3E
MFRDTIFALSSGGLPSGVAVIRVSGPDVEPVLRGAIGRIPASRKAELCTIRQQDGTVLDRGLVVYFPAPHSFTGEECVEFHLHGGKAVVQAMLSFLTTFEGLRHAEAGEFTRRAFINGKVDLTGAEALGDLIASETEAQRRLAVTHADGGQAKLYAGWRNQLLHARAMIEAELDFADEADVPGSVSDQVWQSMRSLHSQIEQHLTGYHAAEIVREGFRVALIGAPNAGKSSLLNALARRDVAIVTDVPGTTRDTIDVVLDLSGYKIIVTDTAGLRDTTDIVEVIGVQRALAAAANADLILELIDSSDRNLPSPLSVPQNTVWRIGTKRDLQTADAREEFDHLVSSHTGEGLNGLLDAIASKAADAGSVTSIVPFRARHVELLTMCAGHVANAAGEPAADLELRAEELRLAGDALGRITGAVDVEELLGVIFSQFCIGK